MAGERWKFTKSQLINTPSRKNGMDSDKELSNRQQAANLIQDMGQRLQVTQLCINTAIVYMHRFYMFNSFTRFHRNNMAAACLFLAAKVEEQPRKLEHVIKVSHLLLHKDGPPLNTTSDAYLEQAQELVVNENILLQTLGFDLTVDHPHTNVVKTCQLVRASKDLAQTSYFLATNSLHLTTMCLQYKPTIVSCVCVHLACKWADWEIPRSSEGKEWYWYVDKSVTAELLEELTQDFLKILEKCPSKLRKKIMAPKAGKDIYDDQFEAPPEKKQKTEHVSTGSHGDRSSAAGTTKPTAAVHHHTPTNHDRKADLHGPAVTAASSLGKVDPIAHLKSSLEGSVRSDGSQPNTPRGHGAAVPQELNKKRSEATHSTTLKEYKERKEREKLAASQSRQNTPDSDRKLHGLSDLDKDGKLHHKSRGDQVVGSDKKVHVKREPGSHQNTPPLVLKLGDIKQEPLSPLKTKAHSADKRTRVKIEPDSLHEIHQNTPPVALNLGDLKQESLSPHKMKTHELQRDASSPLKLKIKTMSLQRDQRHHGDRVPSHHKTHSEQRKDGAEGHSVKKFKSDSDVLSRQVHSGDHKDKSSLTMKIPKLESHRQSSHSQGEGHSQSGTNGRPDLKLHINMSAIRKQSSKDPNISLGGSKSASELNHSGKRDRDRHSRSSKHPRHDQGAVSRVPHQSHQWGAGDPSAIAASGFSSPLFGKRPPSPPSEATEMLKHKVARTESAGLRRSSSSHSVVSMDMSDKESTGDPFSVEAELAVRGLETNGSGTSPHPPGTPQTPHKETIAQLQLLNQLIERQKSSLAHQMSVNPHQMLQTQQSLFDLDFYSNPPLPHEPPPPPPSPPGDAPPPPPPPPMGHPPF